MLQTGYGTKGVPWHIFGTLGYRENPVADAGRDHVAFDVLNRGRPMRIRLLLAAAAALTLAACSESSTSPRLTPTGAMKDITCRSGYHIATREDGTQECVPDEDGNRMAPTKR